MPTDRAIAETPPAAGAAGRGEDLTAILRDCMLVTQRLQSTHETLQREVVRLRGELASKDRELERRRRLAALGELAAGVAHEVRNPLGAIQLCSGMLRQQYGQQADALRLITQIEAGIQAIDAVVRDTLALTPRSTRLNEFGLRDLLAQALAFCEAPLAKRGTRLRIRGTTPDVRLVGEPAALQRVVVNLITNAAEASPAGGEVELEIEASPAGTVSFHVADRGCGLSEEVLERLFDPFFTTKPNGTGLGLSIAHRLVEAHGGRLTARNRAGGGAVFTLVLPLDSARDGAAAGSAEADVPSAA